MSTAAAPAATERRLDEEELLGSILFAPEHLEAVRHKLRPSHFDDPHLGELYGVMLRIPHLTPQGILESLGKRTVAPPPGLSWLVYLSTLEDAGMVLSGASIVAHSKAIIARALDRRRREVLLRAGSIGANGDDLAAGAAFIRRDLEDIEREAGPVLAASILQASRSYAETVTDPTPRPTSLLGDGLFCARCIGEIHGPDGSRKSQGALQLLLSASIGRPFAGIATIPTGIRCGYVSIEDEIDVVRERLQTLALGMGLTEAEEALATENLHILASPYLPDDPEFDVTEDTSQEALEQWIRAHELRLVVIDHLEAAAPSLESENDLRPVSRPSIRIARRTGCGILWAHHDRKAQQGVKGRDRGASRGDSRFAARCRFRIHSEVIGDENPDGTKIRWTFEKSTRAATPRPVYFIHRKDQPLEQTDAPERSREKAASRKAATREIIREAGPAGISPAELQVLLGVSAKTVVAYVASLGDVVTTGTTTNRRYKLRGTGVSSCGSPEDGAIA